MEGKKLVVSITMLTLIITAILTATPSRGTSHKEKVSPLTKNFSTPDDYSPDGTPPPTEWNKTYGGTGWEVANSVIQTSDGDYMLAGYTESYGAGAGDFWLVKTNSAGRMLWNRTYGGAYYDECISLIPTSDGGYALAGVTRSFGAGVTDFWLVKTDSNGAHQWNRTYGEEGYDYLFSALGTNDNGYALIGYTESYGQNGDFWLVKTDSSGNTQWNKTYGGEGWDEPHAIIQTSEGGYAIVGETDSTGAGLTDFWWIKIASDGKKIKDQTYGGVNAEGAYSIVQASDGGFVIAGYSESFGNGIPDYADFWLIKIDSNGRQLWDRTYGGLNTESAQSLISTTNGGFAIAGDTLSYGAGDRDFWLVTTDSGGVLNWNQTYGGVGYDFPCSLISTSDNGLILAGNTFSYGAGSADMWLVKVEGTIPRHDLAVIDVAASKTVVGQGYSMFINVTVENQGNRVELFNATLYANVTIVDSLTSLQTLTSGSIRVLQLMWNTAEEGYVRGGYIIKAEIMMEPPSVDSDPADNLHVNGAVSVSFPGDVDANNLVDALDMYELGQAFSSQHASPNWNANCDIDNNDSVNTADLSIAVENYGKTNN